jgi:hypothetical protein
MVGELSPQDDKNQQDETPSQRDTGGKRYFKHSPRKKRNRDTPLDYKGRTALRREQCDEMPESRNRGFISEVMNCKSLHDKI